MLARGGLAVVVLGGELDVPSGERTSFTRMRPWRVSTRALAVERQPVTTGACRIGTGRRFTDEAALPPG